jgi:hypothetical protein
VKSHELHAALSGATPFVTAQPSVRHTAPPLHQNLLGFFCKTHVREMEREKQPRHFRNMYANHTAHLTSFILGTIHAVARENPRPPG